MNLYETIKTALVSGGMSESSSEALAVLLSFHYPEHAEILLRHMGENELPS